MKAMMKGTAFLATAMGCSSARLPETNRSRPKGGVARPMDRQHTRMTPKWTSSTPRACTAGSSTGARMMMAGPVSMTMPSSRKMTTSTVSRAQLELKLAVRKLVTALVALVRESTRPKAVAKASTKARPP